MFCKAIKKSCPTRVMVNSDQVNIARLSATFSHSNNTATSKAMFSSASYGSAKL